MWPDDETPEPAAWINFNAATGERNVSFECESELASVPLWPEPPRREWEDAMQICLDYHRAGGTAWDCWNALRMLDEENCRHEKTRANT